MTTERLQTVHSVLEETDARLKAGEAAGAKLWLTGFGALDKALAGGFRSGELVLLGGGQGLGKTTFALQVMRNLSATGHSAVYFSFDHDNHTLIERLIAMEAAEIAGPLGVPLKSVREAFEARYRREPTIEGRLADTEGGVEAVEELRAYGRRLHLHRSKSSDTDVEAMRQIIVQIRDETGQAPFVVVDSLQKVHFNTPGLLLSEDDRVTFVVEALKDVTLELGVPVLAIVAGGPTSGKRMRIQDLRGSSALAVPADVVLIFNEKFDVVARHHLVYNLASAERFRSWVVMSIEKNRNGVDRVNLEFQKALKQGRFEPEGGRVEEELVDDRIFVD
ncbi:MAG: AAA family ATPase [Actinobacteria bacterium]|nr:AAA family ATPase [Actinomycetota bacterium]